MDFSVRKETSCTWLFACILKHYGLFSMRENGYRGNSNNFNEVIELSLEKSYQGVFINIKIFLVGIFQHV